MEHVVNAAELAFELRYRALGLIDGRQRIHHLLLVTGDALLGLVDGLEGSRHVATHERLHFLQGSYDRRSVDSELTVRMSRHDDQQGKRHNRRLQKGWPIPGTPKLSGFDLRHRLRGLRLSFTPPEQWSTQLVCAFFRVRHSDSP